MRQKATREVREPVFVQSLPVTAMDEHRQWRRPRRVWPEYIQHLARTAAIGDVDLGMFMGRAQRGRVMLPALHDGRMRRHFGAVIVFAFHRLIVHAHARLRRYDPVL
jgi:hypothetical protein